MDEKPDTFGPGDRVAVLVPVPLGTAYDYGVPDGMELGLGDVVRVPLGPRKIDGVVWGPGVGKVAQAKLKSVLKRHPVPPMEDVQRRFVDWISAYTLSRPGAVLKMALSVPDALDPPKALRAYKKAAAPPELKMTPARTRVLAVLEHTPPLTSADLAREAGCTASVVAGLFKTGVLDEVEIRPLPALASPDPEHPGPELSPKQLEAARALAGKVGKGFSTTVLDGVTGSGKTEVYFEAVAEALRQGTQVLVLLPEIALSSQWLERFRKRFGVKPAEWHSDLGASTRRQTWRAVAEGRARVVVGARSALFLPYHDLGLIVVDEEHEAAFKQEEGVIYNARDMAVVRAHLGEIPITLVSATPSLESTINAIGGKYDLLHLPERHGGASLPAIELVDMRKDKLPASRWLSERLSAALTATFAAGEQAMLFLNRRGYAPLTLCRTCGHRLHCPNCTAWLVEHRSGKRLQCHHCGHSVPVPERCPECDNENTLHAIGPGVERLAEEIQDRFPDIRFALASSDTVSTPRAAADLVGRIERHEVDLIIGTQIVAKGYHFPLLTLVGVVDGDLGLAGGDLRAAERTYQLLHQVSGRAGRGERAGRVLVQTYHPTHPVMQAIESGEREQFIEQEALAREELHMPPFGRLVALIVSGENEAHVDRVAAELGRVRPRGDGIQVLGPAPAPLAFLRGRHRRRLLLKTAKEIAPQPIVRDWIGRVGKTGQVRIAADVDPQSFL